MRKPRKIIGGWLAGMLLLVAAGCSDDGGEDLSAVTSIPDDPSTTTTDTTEPRTVAVDVIPRDESLITEEYVENVLNALYEIDLEAVLAVRGEGVVDQTAVRLIEATVGSEESIRVLNSLADQTRDEFANYKANPTPTTAEVRQVLVGRRDCILVEVALDHSGLLIDPPRPDASIRRFAELRPADAEQLPLNPSAWALQQVRVTVDGRALKDLCDATS